jgi:acetyl-CoA carboxylase carboxyl transferase subunit alpha
VRAAESLGLTAQRLFDLGLIDEIVKEPAGGAHTDPAGAAALLDVALETHLCDLLEQKPDRLVRTRAEKYFKMGVYAEG